MVKQGDIITVRINTKDGDMRALVVSNDFFNQKTDLVIVCPILDTGDSFPLHVALDNRTRTTGFVFCEHIKTLDLRIRVHRVIEHLPEDLLKTVVEAVFAEIEVWKYKTP